jgi:hypothetical protein
MNKADAMRSLKNITKLDHDQLFEYLQIANDGKPVDGISKQMIIDDMAIIKKRKKVTYDN